MSNMESLPDDIVFNILVRVPAQDIYKATRLVCRKWYKMIHTHNFVLAHDLQHSSCGLIAWILGSRAFRSAFIEFRNGQVEVSTIGLTRNVFASCNGLILGPRGAKQPPDLCIVNPSTKQHFSLPPFLDDQALGEAIAYDATSKVYKVVRTLYKLPCKILECAIFTVGVDIDWTRRVDIEHLPLKANEILLLGDLIATDGFVHWCICGCIRKRGEPEHVLTLNVETEVITQFPVPVCDAAIWYYYLPIKRGLCLMIGRTGFFWEAWEMNPESGEWTMVVTIDLEAQKQEFEWVCPRIRLMPVGWLKFRELLVFRVCRYVTLDYSIPTKYTIAYSCCTHSIISSFELVPGLSRFNVYRNSIIWVG